MKRNALKYLLVVFYLASCLSTMAQQSAAKISNNAYPATFVISKNEFNNLFLLKTSEQVSGKGNKFLEGASLLMNTGNGDMKFLKLKLDYFKNAFLMIQVNGTATTQVFILSDDKSVFYKGRFEKSNLVMSKCSEGEIVSE